MRARRALLFSFAFTAVYFTGFFPESNNPNELSRIEAIVAFVESGTFSIDGAIARLGDHMDKSIWQGHFYSNKAPGLIFAAVPVYRLLRVFFVEPRSPRSVIFVLLRLSTVSLVCLVALARFGRRLEEIPGARMAAPLVAFAAAFGTPFLYYGRSLFSHAWTASLLFLAWDRVRESEERRRGKAALLICAGLLGGLAAISEYTAAPIAAALALRAAGGAAGHRAEAFFLFASGIAPLLLLLAAYDAACFGSPLRLSSACEAFPAHAKLASLPLFGVGPPRLSTALATLFSASRGAILFSPFWLWAVGGWVRWWRAGRQRGDCLFSFTAFLLIWILITGYPNWEGGWSLGMRYLVPVLFLVALAIPWALETPLSRGLFLSAVVVSAALQLLASFTWPHFPASIAWPTTNVSAWLVSRGAVAPNLGLLLGFSPLVSLLAPLGAAAVALALCVREFPPARPRPIGACVLGLSLFALTLARPPAVSASDVAWREELARKLRGGASTARPAGSAQYNQRSE